jgi:hypothetical protein
VRCTRKRIRFILIDLHVCQPRWGTPLLALSLPITSRARNPLCDESTLFRIFTRHTVESDFAHFLKTVGTIARNRPLVANPFRNWTHRFKTVFIRLSTNPRRSRKHSRARSILAAPTSAFPTRGFRSEPMPIGNENDWRGAFDLELKKLVLSVIQRCAPTSLTPQKPKNGAWPCSHDQRSAYL